jgi:hypothetical protein
VVQSRDVINRFVRTGCVNKGKSTGRPPISEKVVGDLGERLEHVWPYLDIEVPCV